MLGFQAKVPLENSFFLLFSSLNKKSSKHHQENLDKRIKRYKNFTENQFSSLNLAHQKLTSYVRNVNLQNLMLRISFYHLAEFLILNKTYMVIKILSSLFSVNRKQFKFNFVNIVHRTF